MKCQYQAVTSTTMRRDSNGPAQNDGRSGYQQSQDAAEQMHRVPAGQQINETNCWGRWRRRSRAMPGLSRPAIVRPGNPGRARWSAPSHGNSLSVPSDTPGIDSTGSKGDAADQLAPRQLDGHAAQQQHERIDQETARWAAVRAASRARPCWCWDRSVGNPWRTM